MIEMYDREAIKATDQLYRLLISSDVPLTVHIKRVDFETLGPQFLRFLSSACGVHQRIAYLLGIGNRFPLSLPLYLVFPLVYRHCSSWLGGLVASLVLLYVGDAEVSKQWTKSGALVPCCLFTGGRTSLIAICLSSLCVSFLRMDFMP